MPEYINMTGQLNSYMVKASPWAEKVTFYIFRRIFLEYKALHNNTVIFKRQILVN